MLRGRNSWACAIAPSEQLAAMARTENLSRFISLLFDTHFAFHIIFACKFRKKF